MTSSRHQIGFFIRVLLLALALALLMYWLFVDVQYLRTIYLLVVIAYLIWSIYWKISQISRDFYTFITALANEEYSVQFSEEKRNKSIQDLYHLYNITARRFQRVKEERDMQHLFLQEILNQIEVGILAFNEDEKILLVNRAYLRLFQCTKPKSLDEVTPSIVITIRTITSNQPKIIFPFVGDEKLTLSVHSTNFVLREQKLTLIYFHNIKSEMDEQEMESWQKLFSVLTHEIMNSVTPISSLSASLNDKLKRDLSDKGIPELRTVILLSEGLDAVSDRSKGLLTFTESFRKLSKLPQPKLNPIDLREMLERIRVLLSEDLQRSRTVLTINISKECSVIYADLQQFEQLMINLIKNAIESFERLSQGIISIEVKRIESDKVQIEVCDNGKGMSTELIDKAFVPFFTTKDKGSGIGLSLCRQIIRMHGGTIDLKSVEGEGTRVIVKI
jgi:nitrogen fixation/metabolism regulation signal transduction histidine kinase